MDSRLVDIDNRSRMYLLWHYMKGRCYNSNHVSYEYYGGRGIKVCDEWRDDSIAFILWASANGYKPGLYIDRIDNEKGYSPDNCRFVTPAESTLNSRPKNSNTSGFIGVYLDKKTMKYKAQIQKDGKNHSLGHFASPRLAAIRYDVEAFMLNDGRPVNFKPSLF